MINVLFVCLGNICRSPMAEAVFTNLVEQAGLSKHFHIDSAGIESYHEGEPPHLGTQQILRRHHIPYHGHARQVAPTDFKTFDYILAMDSENLADLKQLDGHPESPHKLYRLLEFAHNSGVTEVPDPYYTGNFDYVHRLVLAGCQGLLAHIQHEHHL